MNFGTLTTLCLEKMQVRDQLTQAQLGTHIVQLWTFWNLTHKIKSEPQILVAFLLFSASARAPYSHGYRRNHIQ